MACGRRRDYDQEQEQDRKAAGMAPDKAMGRRARRKASAGRGSSEPIDHAAETDAAPDRGITLVDIDPWSAFFEKFWEQPQEHEGAQRGDEGRKAGKNTRTSGPKSVRRRQRAGGQLADIDKLR